MNEFKDFKDRAESAADFRDQFTEEEWVAEFGYEAIKDRENLVAALEAVQKLGGWWESRGWVEGSDAEFYGVAIREAIAEALEGGAV